MQIEDKLEKVHSKKDFVDFVNHLVKDLKQNPKDWANTTLEDFLNGISSWVDDSDGLFSGENPLDDADWNLIATLFFTGSRYE